MRKDSWFFYTGTSIPEIFARYYDKMDWQVKEKLKRGKALESMYDFAHSPLAILPFNILLSGDAQPLLPPRPGKSFAGGYARSNSPQPRLSNRGRCDLRLWRPLPKFPRNPFAKYQLRCNNMGLFGGRAGGEGLHSRARNLRAGAAPPYLQRFAIKRLANLPGRALPPLHCATFPGCTHFPFTQNLADSSAALPGTAVKE